MLVVIQNQFVVNLIRENYQVVPAGQFRDLLQHAARAHRAGGIIGIDQHNAAGARCDLLMDVHQIGLPAVIFIKPIRV